MTAGPIVQPGRQWGRSVRVVVTPLSGLPPIVINPVTYAPGAGPPPLHVSFSVDKTLTSEPQRGRVSITNLSKATRDLLAAVARSGPNVSAVGATTDTRVIATTLVQIEAGYLGLAPGVLLRGNLTAARSRHYGTEWVTTLDVGDTEAAIAMAECRRTFDAGTPALAVLTYAASCMGVVSVSASVPAAISAYVLERGFVAYGRARDTIDAILAGVAPDLSQLGFLARGIAIGADLWDAFAGNGPLTNPIGWWVDDGAIYFLERGLALPAPPVLVSATAEPGTVRLVERPERLEDGAIRLVTLLNPGTRLGRPITVVSRELAGAYRVEAVSHTGDNRGGDFLTTAICRPLF
jgi:hypothetical protein